MSTNVAIVTRHAEAKLYMYAMSKIYASTLNLHALYASTLSQHKARLLARAAASVLMAQPTVVRVGPPAKVLGDIHGQLRDLLLLLREFGVPTHTTGDVECASYVFNGDVSALSLEPVTSM